MKPSQAGSGCHAERKRKYHAHWGLLARKIPDPGSGTGVGPGWVSCVQAASLLISALVGRGDE